MGGDKYGSETKFGQRRRRRAISDADKLFAKLSRFKRREAMTLHFIQETLSSIDGTWTISFSGGKDSTVMLDLVRRVASDTVAVFADSGAEYPETLDIMAKTANVKTYYPELTILEMYRMVDRYGHTDGEYGSDWHWPMGSIKRCMIYEPMTRAQDELHATGGFIGLRAEESYGREMLRRIRGKLLQAKAGDWRCYPMLDWTTEDIWAYIASRNLEYNEVYDILAEIGEPREQWRVAPYAGGTALGFGRWATLKRGWPSLFNRFAAEFPEARSYV